MGKFCYFFGRFQSNRVDPTPFLCTNNVHSLFSYMSSRVSLHGPVADAHRTSRPNPPAPLLPLSALTLPPETPALNTPSTPSSKRRAMRLAFGPEHQLSNRMGQSCIALLCAKCASNWGVSRPRPLSYSQQMDSRNRMAIASRF